MCSCNNLTKSIILAFLQISLWKPVPLHIHCHVFTAPGNSKRIMVVVCIKAALPLIAPDQTLQTQYPLITQRTYM